jgi:SAM-dependent methyltransferase
VVDRICLALFNLLCRLFPGRDPSGGTDHVPYFESGFGSTSRFFERLGGTVSLEGTRMLDIGCGYGTTCVYAAQHGAALATGVDSDAERIEFARRHIPERYPEVSDRVRLHIEDTIEVVRDQRFDLIVLKDSFEHIDEPEQAINDIKTLLAPGGAIAIGNPPWKSFYGGHTNFMTRFPWVHLIFPERIVMQARRRFRPDEPPASRYEDVRGGMNRMTIRKFEGIMSRSGLRQELFAINQGSHPAHRALRLLRRLPFGREIFAANVYGVWRAAEPSP